MFILWQSREIKKKVPTRTFYDQYDFLSCCSMNMHFIAEHQEKWQLRMESLHLSLHLSLFFLHALYSLSLCRLGCLCQQRLDEGKGLRISQQNPESLCTVSFVLSWGTSEPSPTDLGVAEYSFHQSPLQDREPRRGPHPSCVSLQSPTLFLKLDGVFGRNHNAV